MAEEKQQKTLFDVVKPLIQLLNLVYGLNLGHRKPPGYVKQLRRKLYKQCVCIVFFLSISFYYGFRLDPNQITFLHRSYLIINLFCCSFFLFAFNEPEMERLLRRLKQHQMGRMSERVTSKMIKVFFVAMALIPLPLTKIAFKMLRQMVKVYGYYKENNSLSKAINHLTQEALFFLCLSVALLFALALLIFPVLLSCLCCVLVSYCPSRLDDHVEDILRAHSPLRRATLLSKLCYHYYRLQPLASMTNRSMATTMSLMKIVTMLLWVICLHFLEKQNIETIFDLPFLQYTLPLLMYLRVAPSANDMHCKVFEAAAEVLMVDDKWHVRDPISRALLIKLRLNLLQHLVHIRMDQGPFTLLGDSVDPETLFTIFIEANDLRTTLR